MSAAESAPLIARYVDAAEAYGAAVEANDPERIHAAQAVLPSAFNELVKCDPSRAVLPLLEDDRFVGARDELTIALVFD